MASSTPAVATGLAINGTQMCFISAHPLIKYEFVDPNAQLMCGVLDDVIETITPGIEHHGWRVLLQPHPGELDILIPLIGTTESPTDTFTPDDTPTTFTTLVRLKSTTQLAYSTTGCMVDKAIFRAQKGGSPLSLQLDIIGQASAETATFSPSTITRQAPYPFTSSTLTLGGTEHEPDQVVIVHDNHVRKRFNNSVTADVIQNTRRTLHIGCNTPYTDTEDGTLTTAIGATRAAGIAVNLQFSRNNQELTWDVTKAIWAATPPAITGKQDEVRMYSWWQAVKSGSNALFTITQDATA